ncbi:MAG: TetR/AcrR family transcriptional regulator [Pseudomonadota bacterium]
MDKSIVPARQKFVDAARPLFAARGYYGVSLASVAHELGLTKQSVLHHFGSKEALYGAVLEQLAERYTSVMEAAGAGTAGPETRLAAALTALHSHMMAEREDARIVMRELLDNVDRAPSSRKWYLRAFLDDLTAMLRAHPSWHGSTDAELAAGIYQLVGAINYFAISTPTLTGIWGDEPVARMEDAFLPVLLGRLRQR